MPEECPAEIAALIKACLSPDPGARPSSTAIFRALRAQAAPPSAPPLTPALSAAMLAASVTGASRQGSAELGTGLGLGMRGLAASERGSAEEGSPGWPAGHSPWPGANPPPGVTPGSRPASPLPLRSSGFGSRVSPEASAHGLATPPRAGCGPGSGSGSGAAVELARVGLGAEGTPSAPAPATPARFPGGPRPALASPAPSGPDAAVGGPVPNSALPPAPSGQHAPAGAAAPDLAAPGPGGPGAAGNEQPSPVPSGARGPAAGGAGSSTAGGLPDAQGLGVKGPWPWCGSGGHAGQAAGRDAGSCVRVGGSDGAVRGPSPASPAALSMNCDPPVPGSHISASAGPGAGVDDGAPPVPRSYFSSTAGPGPGAHAGGSGPPVPCSYFSSPGPGPAADAGVAAAAHDEALPVPRSYFTPAAGPGSGLSQGHSEPPVPGCSLAAAALADDAPRMPSPFAEYATGLGLGREHGMDSNKQSAGETESGEPASGEPCPGGYEAVPSPERGAGEVDWNGRAPGAAPAAQPEASIRVPETPDRAPMSRAHSASGRVPPPPALRSPSAEMLPTSRVPLAASAQQAGNVPAAGVPVAGAKTPERLAGVPPVSVPQPRAAVPLATVQTACSGCSDVGESRAASGDGALKVAPMVAADAPKAGLAGSLQRLFLRQATTQ